LLSQTAVAAACALLALGLLGTGCAKRETANAEHGHHDEDSHGHEHHDHEEGEEGDHDEAPLSEADIDMPRDFRGATERLGDYRRRILSAIISKHAHDAHRPLDEMDLVITKLMVLARDSGVPRGDWEEVNLARRELRAQFDIAHAAIDKEETPDVARLEESTAAPLARLEAIAARVPATREAEAQPVHESARAEEAQP
jgi:hypothetical protein